MALCARGLVGGGQRLTRRRGRDCRDFLGGIAEGVGNGLEDPLRLPAQRAVGLVAVADLDCSVGGEIEIDERIGAVGRLAGKGEPETARLRGPDGRAFAERVCPGCVRRITVVLASPAHR